MRASNIVSNIAGIPQFQSLKPSQKIAVGVVSISFAVTIIGLPFAPFVYRGLVEVLKRYTKSPKENPRMRELQKQQFGKEETREKDVTETNKSKRVRTPESKNTGKTQPTKNKGKAQEAESTVKTQETASLTPQDVLRNRLVEEGFIVSQLPGTGSFPMPAKDVPLQKYALLHHDGYLLYFATGSGYSSAHVDIYFEMLENEGLENCLQRTFNLIDTLIARKRVIESQGFFFINNLDTIPVRERGQILKLAKDNTENFKQDFQDMKRYVTVLKYVGDDGEVTYTLRDNNLALAITTLETKLKALGKEA